MIEILKRIPAIFQIEYEPYDRVVERYMNEMDRVRSAYWRLFDSNSTDCSPEAIEERERALRRMDITATMKPLQGRILRIGFVRIPLLPRILPGS